MFNDLPSTIVALTVCSYWTCVVVLVVRSHLVYRTAAGALPRTSRERRLWWLWVPAILLWLVIPWLAPTATRAALALPTAAVAHGGWYAVRLAAAGIATAAFLLTIPGWLSMGRSWSMAVVPSKRTRLITGGMFARVRHPIYALSILMMLATMTAVPAPAMIVVGLVHLWMIRMKAMSEEKFLHQFYGPDYAEYCRRTNRFLPRVFSAPAERTHEDSHRQRDKAA